MTSKELYFNLLEYARPYWKMFALSLVAMVLLAATQPILPAFMKPLLDESFVAKNLKSIGIMPILLVVLFIVRGIASFVSTTAMAWVSSRVVMDLRADMFNRILELPKAYFDKHATGNLISKVTFNVDQVTNAVTSSLIILLRDSLTIIGLLGWMFYLDWKLSLIFFVIVPVAGTMVKLAANRLRRLSRSLQENIGDMTHTLEESISGNREIKIYAGQEYERKRFRTINNWVRRFTVKIKTASALNTPVVELIAAIALAVLIYIASVKSAHNEMTVGGFVSFFIAMGMLFAPSKNLTNLNEHIQRGLAAAESIFDLLRESPETDLGTRELGKCDGHIEFRNVSFQYPGNDQTALHNIDLDIKPGETVALIGQSGSGKTTLVTLVPRFYSPSTGTILLDGIDMQEIRLQELRRNIAIVSQQTMLFNDTIRANIAYGFPEQYREEDILEAARAAHVIEFAEKMPDGLDTLVGENGVLLSGGQRQRIAIARAFLKNAPILILDEATSALDNQSEFFIHEAMEKIRFNRTVIIVAHRLSTIRKADRIIVLQNGKIVESGNHDSLMQKNGIYAAMQHVQIPTE
jgi:subfamily B ATP-binding cassette protein MsbA